MAEYKKPGCGELDAVFVGILRGLEWLDGSLGLKRAVRVMAEYKKPDCEELDAVFVGNLNGLEWPDGS